MTRAEALQINRKYRLSDEVKEILKREGLSYRIYANSAPYSDYPTCYVMVISGHYEIISFSEVSSRNNAFDACARKVLRDFWILVP